MAVATTMKAIEIRTPGGPEVLTLVDRPTPQPATNEILIAVSAAALNRGDTMQRMGHYPPPPGITDIPGLEVAGHVAALGEGVTGWALGDRVCALLAGGGYAQYAVAPVGQCMPVPERLTMVEAGGLPETIFTCWTTLIDDGRLRSGETLLIHGGSSGIGTTGIALAKALGATVYVTAGSAEKCQVCRDLGADLAIDYKSEDFVEAIRRTGRDVDVVLDMVGGDYVDRDMQIMARRGRHVSIGLLGNTIDATISMRLLLTKQLVITGSTLRGRTLEQKAAIGTQLRDVVWPMIADGRITPVVHATYTLADAADAHRAMEAGGHIGKIVLTVD
jgi:putative PIG3 family NAD(P)H quinone oxidoreductase